MFFSAFEPQGIILFPDMYKGNWGSSPVRPSSGALVLALQVSWILTRRGKKSAFAVLGIFLRVCDWVRDGNLDPKGVF